MAGATVKQAVPSMPPLLHNLFIGKNVMGSDLSLEDTH